MNENPEGTPNPLNPAPGTGEGLATGTGAFDYAETPAPAEEPAVPETPAISETPANTPEVTEFSEESISFAEEPAAPSPEPRTSYSTADPMMRPASNNLDNNFDTLGVDETVSVDEFATTEPVTPAAVPAEPVEPVSRVTDMSKFVAKDSIVEPANGGGKKKAFIIGAVVLLIIAVICGAAAAAIMLLGNNSGDRVSKAIDKLMNGNVPSIISVQGNIDAISNVDYELEDDAVPSGLDTAMNIDFNGTFDTATGVNSVSAKINTSYDDGRKSTIGIDELTTLEGNTFIKLRGLDTLFNTASEEASTVDCIAGSGDTDCVSVSIGEPTTVTTTTEEPLSAFSGVFDAINDEWILVSDDFTEGMSGLGLFDNSSACLVNAFSTLPSYGSDIASKYKANQFINYSTDKLEISKKKNELYRISFDSDKLAAFINSLSNNGFMNELNACAGDTATNKDVASDTIDQIFKTFPTIYVEVDDNYNFTRVYLKGTVGEGLSAHTTTADLSLSYPPKLDITVPEEYVDMSTLLNNLVTDLFSGLE